MANSCWSKITAFATDSEWREISNAFSADRIDWPIGLSGPDCNDWSKEIDCENKWSAKPWHEGQMGSLSESYPSVVFLYVASYEGGEPDDRTWFCNGDNSNKRDAERERKQAYKAEADRFRVAIPTKAEGISHIVEVMPDGRVAADGENRFGECNIFPWANIKMISCGNWHTVGLKNDGTLVACGSNANQQCEVNGITNAVSVSCGRYHTAILLKDGRVIIKGTLEHDSPGISVNEEKELTKSDFPIICDLQLNKYINGWEKMNDRIERIAAGDELTLKKVSRDGVVFFEVINLRGEKIGEIMPENGNSLNKLLNTVRITADSVTPLSQRRKGSKYAAMTVRIDYIDSNAKQGTAKKLSTTIGDYKQTRIVNWPPVVRIKSVYDAVIGITADNEVYVDGFCPCSEKEIQGIIA